MNLKLTCTLPSSVISYEIEIEPGYLNHSEKLVAELKKQGSQVAIITGEMIAPLYANKLLDTLKAAGLKVHLFSFKTGEEYKTRETKTRLEDQLLDKGFGRDTCIIAMGGGVVTDLVGYLAATYCRGVPLITFPTSLLAMVDACVGGKTGVNTPYGKNLIGSTYQPKKVIIDPHVLSTLPIERLREGAVEMIKHGLIADVAYFEFLEKHTQQLLALDSKTVEKGIFESCRIKKEIVEQDEKENGKRRLLNAGHTVGHALERLTHYSLSHGEAVAIGLLVESHMAMQLGKLSEKNLDRILNILKRYGLPLQLPTFSLDSILDAMVLDKKSVKGKPRFVILKEIGSPLHYNGQFCTEVDETIVKNALNWFHNVIKN